MNTQDIELNVECWLFEGSHPEDGSPQEEESYYVTATLPSGRRFMHFKLWTTQEFFREDAALHAGDLKVRIEMAQKAGTWAGPFNEHWSEIEPVYGSDAYQKLEAKGYWYEKEQVEGI